MALISVGLQGCVVELEGKKRGRYWTFSVVDPSGLSLLRMSTESEKEAEKWVEVLSLIRNFTIQILQSSIRHLRHAACRPLSRLAVRSGT